MALTAKQAKMANVLLEMAADEFSNHGCNDFNLSQFGFTPEEMRQIVREYHEWNGDPEETDDVSDDYLPYALPDFVAMTWLRWKLMGGRL